MPHKFGANASNLVLMPKKMVMEAITESNLTLNSNVNQTQSRKINGT
jgi:hypothetical protein